MPKMTEAQRNSLNQQRLQKISPTIRNQVARCLATLEHYGHRPLIAREVYRTPQKQLELYRTGRSKANWGYHCATTPDGKPDSLAADIIDCEKGWNASREFWATLGYAAYHNGLGWGGLWIKETRVRQATADYVSQKQNAGQQVPDRLRFGWDAAHVETKRVTISEAARGLR
jgi:hypothetical protein